MTIQEQRPIHREIEDGSVWPIPGQETGTLAWRLTHFPSRATPGDLLIAASIISAYTELVALPERVRRQKIRMLRAIQEQPERAGAESQLRQCQTCVDFDEDCPGVVNKVACWLYAPERGMCPYLRVAQPKR